MSSLPPSDSSEIDRLCTEAYALLDARRFTEAETLLLRARDLVPENPRVHYYLGMLLSDLRRPAEALAALDTSLQLDRSNAKAHNNRGSILQILGRLSEAEDAFRRALEICPDLEQPHVNLGKLLEQQGKLREAIDIYDLALSHGLDADIFGQYRAAALGQSTLRSPDRWVSATFDNFAPTFDAHLRELQYDVPRRLAAVVLRRVPCPSDILDLGCGTGQVGVALAEYRHRLTGVDLSEKMLAQARGRNLYAQLHLCEVHAFMRNAAAASFDVACAADVFIYIGALEQLFAEIARVLRTGGWFAFSTEECAGPEFTLQATGRYAQSEAYIRRLAGTAFAVLEATQTTIRMEMASPIAGRIYLLQKR